MSSTLRIFFKEKLYARFTLSNIISRFGDSIDMIAMSWLTFEITQDAALTSLIFALNIIPNVFIQPIGGVLVRRFNYKYLLVISDFMRGTFVFGAYLLLCLNQLTFVHILILTVLNSTIESFNMPANSPFVYDIVTSENYADCTSISQGLNRLSELIGKAIAGTLITLLGAPIALFIDALTFLISGLICATIPYQSKADKTVKVQVKPVLCDMKAGFTYLCSKQILLTMSISLAIINVMFVPFSSYMVAYAVDYLMADVQYISIAFSLFSFTTIIGSLIASKAINKFKVSKLLSLFLIISSMFNIILAALSYLSNAALAQTILVILFAPLGLLVGVLSVFISTQLLLHTEQTYLSRVMSLINAICLALLPIVSLVCSFLAIYFDLNICLFIISIPFIIMVSFFFNKFDITVLD